MSWYLAFDLPPIGSQEWREEALCAQLVMDHPQMAVLWDGDGTDTQVQTAVRICLMCPVKAECLKDALRTPAYGIRGGKRARSRKDGLRYG